MSAKKMYLLLGYPDEDNAPVLSTAESLREARRDKREYGGVIYEYDAVNGELRNGRMVS